MPEQNPENNPDTIATPIGPESTPEQPPKEKSALNIMVEAAKTAESDVRKIIDNKMGGKEGLDQPAVQTEIIMDPEVQAALERSRLANEALDHTADASVGFLKDYDIKGLQGPIEGETRKDEKNRTIGNLNTIKGNIANRLITAANDENNIRLGGKLPAINFAIRTLSPKEPEAESPTQPAASAETPTK